MEYNFCPFCAEETTDDLNVHGQNCFDYQESLATNKCPFCSCPEEECFVQAHAKFRIAMKSKSIPIEYPKLEENEDFVRIKNGTKIWEFFLFNHKDKIAKCTICSNTKRVLKGTQGLNIHMEAQHPNIFESFNENIMPLKNKKTKKSFKKTIKKSKCEPNADILEKNINSTNPKKKAPNSPKTDEKLWEQILGYETENTFEANYTQADLDFVLL